MKLHYEDILKKIKTEIMDGKDTYTKQEIYVIISAMFEEIEKQLDKILNLERND